MTGAEEVSSNEGNPFFKNGSAVIFAVERKGRKRKITSEFSSHKYS